MLDKYGTCLLASGVWRSSKDARGLSYTMVQASLAQFVRDKVHGVGYSTTVQYYCCCWYSLSLSTRGSCFRGRHRCGSCTPRWIARPLSAKRRCPLCGRYGIMVLSRSARGWKFFFLVLAEGALFLGLSHSLVFLFSCFVCGKFLSFVGCSVRVYVCKYIFRRSIL